MSYLMKFIMVKPNSALRLSALGNAKPSPKSVSSSSILASPLYYRGQ